MTPRATVKDRTRQPSRPDDYRLWLLLAGDGRITLTGWSEPGSTQTEPAATGTVSYWPEYPLCESTALLPEQLTELGLQLAPGAAFADLERGWDVYVQHPDIKALRTVLTRRATAPCS